MTGAEPVRRSIQAVVGFGIQTRSLYPPAKPFSCITYGKVPPGYKEKAAALPLIPERLYSALILDIGRGAPNSWVYFIIRSDSTGNPIKIERFGVNDGGDVT